MVPQIITHLQANTTSFPTIQNAWTMEPVEDLSADIPALYVYHGARSADPELGETTCYRQRITKTVHVFIVCEPDDFETLWNEVWTALVGYQVDPWSEGLAFLEGNVVKQTGQHLWWRDTWQSKSIHSL